MKLLPKLSRGRDERTVIGKAIDAVKTLLIVYVLLAVTVFTSQLVSTINTYQVQIANAMVSPLAK